jgi:hypothetical protein
VLHVTREQISARVMPTRRPSTRAGCVRSATASARQRKTAVRQFWSKIRPSTCPISTSGLLIGECRERRSCGAGQIALYPRYAGVIHHGFGLPAAYDLTSSTPTAARRRHIQPRAGSKTRSRLVPPRLRSLELREYRLHRITARRVRSVRRRWRVELGCLWPSVNFCGRLAASRRQARGIRCRPPSVR